MEKVQLLHNPRCSKSRQALALLEDRGVKVDIIRYLETPLSLDELKRLAEKLEQPVSAMIRRKEPEYKEAGLTNDSSDDEILTAIARFPKLLERPIAIRGNRAIIGRPPENVLKLLND
ncbi:MAG: arsenate reductase (glutaredoxin) [Gammaproteobacteria bacterium]|nr:MAG: arsenate reductase (glutaredoxin) [Gammaproteobacteria bacterium]